MFYQPVSGKIRNELIEAAAPRHVHELTAQTDAKRRHAAFFDFSQQRPFEAFAQRIDGFHFRMRRLPVTARIEIVSARESMPSSESTISGMSEKSVRYGNKNGRPPAASTLEE